MDVTQSETLADQICGCANREQHRRDVALLNEAFTTHRQAALLEGVRIGLEAAARDALTWFPNGQDERHHKGGVVASIRSLDPAAVLARHGGA